MKAILARRLFVSLTTLSCLALTAFPAAAGDDYVPGTPIGPDGEVISAIGLERGLELYDRDAGDACVPGALQIRATVTNVSKKGIVKVELFGEKNFMKKSGKLRRVRIPAEEGSVKICVNLPTPGEYALVGYHDKDGNRKLKKKWNFKPKEPFGVSNNPMIDTVRLPKWSEAGFEVPMSGIDITMDLVDP